MDVGFATTRLRPGPTLASLGSAAYFLDLVSSGQYTGHWKDCCRNAARCASLSCFYVGRRVETEDWIDDATAVYRRAVELGRLPNAEHTANYAAYRLEVLSGVRNGGGERASEELTELVEE